MVKRRSGKWVLGVELDEPVSHAAQLALKSRLPTVWHYLSLAAKAPELDTEYVHQTRVAARRAMAALEVFAELLPPRRAKWIRICVRHARRAAGAARDDDVLLARLAQRAASQNGAGLDHMQQQVQAWRAEHQVPIEKVQRRLRKQNFTRRATKLVKKIRWRGEGKEPTYRAAADGHLAHLGEEFRSLAAGPLDDPAQLHRLRIAGKQLRYALELFAGAYPPELRLDLYPLVSQLQDHLGAVNDHATALARYESWLANSTVASARDALTQMLNEESVAVEQQRGAFLDWWQSGHGAEILQQFERFRSA